jgi:membrane associated rhomboid family serine protease
MWPRLTPVVRILIWSNALIFIASEIVNKASPESWVALDRVLSLNVEMWRATFPLAPYWQLISYGFLHSLSDPFHILFNLLGVYFFGTMLEALIGSRRYLVFYLAAIVIGAVLHLGVSAASGTSASVVGASGGVLATIVGAAVLRPRDRVIFIVFPLSLKVMAMIMVGLDLFSFTFGGGGRVAYVVHLGGAAWGFCALRFGWIWADPRAAWRRHRIRRATEERQSDEERLDRLLAQIHDRGMHSLSDSDREFLKRVANRS